MTRSQAINFLTQQRSSCRICYAMGRRTHGDPARVEVHTSMLIGGTAAGSRTFGVNTGPYWNAVLRNLERHLRAEHRDHPMVKRFAPELAS